MRFRSKFENPEDSNITCSLCGTRGHNKRRCPHDNETEQSNMARTTATTSAQSNLTDAKHAAALDPGFAQNMM
jgi:hypothetical protein